MAAEVNLAERRQIGPQQGGSSLWPQVSARWIAKRREVEPMQTVQLERQLARVGVGVAVTIDRAKVAQREPLRRNEGRRPPLPVVGSEREQPIAPERPADLEPRVAE